MSEAGRRYTEEELRIAKSVDLTAVAQQLGYTVVRVGSMYTLKEMDSIRIYNRRSWFRWSRVAEKGSNGGTQIDFLRVFGGMTVKDAVFWLLDFAGYRRLDQEGAQPLKYQVKEEAKKKLFCLPEPAAGYDAVYRYLGEERGIDREVIDFFIRQDLIYASRRYGDVVFKGNDRNGVTHFASLRGPDIKRDVAGNDKHYGFNCWNDDSTELEVFEGAIDLLSFTELTQDYETNKLALGMLADAPLETFLEEHPQIRSIAFCLDNDQPGREATERLMRKYYERGYEVEDTVQVNEVRTTNPESAVRAYASVTFEGAFKVCNIAILENRATGEPFISMPNYKTRRVDEKNQPQYQDICYPVTKEFREQLYGDILAEYRNQTKTKPGQGREQERKNNYNRANTSGGRGCR